jgi:hypothetical protein
MELMELSRELVIILILLLSVLNISRINNKTSKLFYTNINTFYIFSEKNTYIKTESIQLLSILGTNDRMLFIQLDLFPVDIGIKTQIKNIIIREYYAFRI